MAKQIIFREKAKEGLKKELMRWPTPSKSLSVRKAGMLFWKKAMAPTITNDGVTIAKEIELEDKVENMGAEIAKEVASKTNDLAGDGTTTAVVLTQAIIKEGMRVTTLGVNPLGIRRGIEAATVAVVAALKKIAKPIKNKEEIEQVATVSAESEEFGKKIAHAIDKVGKDGVVTVEESQSFGVESEFVEGMQFDKGYVSPYMITNADRMEAVYEEPLILLVDKKFQPLAKFCPCWKK